LPPIHQRNTVCDSNKDKKRNRNSRNGRNSRNNPNGRNGRSGHCTPNIPNNPNTPSNNVYKKDPETPTPMGHHHNLWQNIPIATTATDAPRLVNPVPTNAAGPMTTLVVAMAVAMDGPPRNKVPNTHPLPNNKSNVCSSPDQWGPPWHFKTVSVPVHCHMRPAMRHPTKEEENNTIPPPLLLPPPPAKPPPKTNWNWPFNKVHGCRLALHMVECLPNAKTEPCWWIGRTIRR